jgi:hypothetical protein
MARSPGTFKKGRPKTGGRRPGSPNRVTVEVREAARQLVEDPAYRAALRTRLIRGRAPEIEKELWHYAYGKPPSFAEVPQTPPPQRKYDVSTLDADDWAAMRRIYAKAAPAGAPALGAASRPPTGSDPARPLPPWMRPRQDPPRL